MSLVKVAKYNLMKNKNKNFISGNVQEKYKGLSINHNELKIEC